MKPINMKTWEVQALLDNRKTVVRRVMKPQPVWSSCGMRWSWKNAGWWRDGWDPIETITWKNTPYRPGDILYVREAWAAWSRTIGTIPRILYKADRYIDAKKIKWRPSIHMPRDAARIFLRVTDVRVERLQNISSQDIEREGIDLTDLQGLGCITRGEYVYAFQQLWDSTIKSKNRALYGWIANPWVWVVEFEKISKEMAENES